MSSNGKFGFLLSYHFQREVSLSQSSSTHLTEGTGLASSKVAIHSASSTGRLRLLVLLKRPTKYLQYISKQATLVEMMW